MKPSSILAALIPLIMTASAAAQVPAAIQLLHLRLHDGFTLTYQVTVRDVRTLALREKDKTEQQKGVAKEEAAGRIAPSMRDYFEKQALQLGLTRPAEHFTITLSARDGKLLYLSSRSAKDQRNGTKRAIVLEGDKEYEAADATGAIINNDGWRNAPVYVEENVDRLAFCPLPGVGLPNVDLIQSPSAPSKLPNGHFLYKGLVPRLNLIDGDTPYKAGSAEASLAQGRLQVVSLTVGTMAVLQEKWQITAFRLFQGHWIGTQMQMTEYEAALADAGEKLTSNLPTSVADYQLVKVRSVALDASALEIGTYLRDKASVSDNSTGTTLTFAYDKNGGTLKEQVETAHKKESQKYLKTP